MRKLFNILIVIALIASLAGTSILVYVETRTAPTETTQAP